jgi:hypothetical protein
MRTYPEHFPVSLTLCNDCEKLEMDDRRTVACLLHHSITTSGSDRERLARTRNTYGICCTMVLTLIRRIVVIDGETT